MTLKEFLIERKFKMLEYERRATKSAKLSINAQLQVFDVILAFLSSNQTEEDMAKLQLTLDKQARPLEELKPRQENADLTEALLELAETLKPNSYKQLNLPADMKMRSVTAKIYALRKAGKLPDNIKPLTRGKEVYLARKGE